MKINASGIDISRPGYTLIEMLIASVLVATLMSAVWGMMSMYNSYLVIGQDQSREQQLVRSLFQLIADDLYRVALPDSGRAVVASFNPDGPVPQSFGTTDGMSTGAAADLFRFDASPLDIAGSSENFGTSLDSAGDVTGTAGETGIMDGTETISSPGVAAFSGTQQNFQLTIRRSNPDPFFLPSAGDLQERGLINPTAPVADELPVQESQEGKAPLVTEFATIIYQFQSPESMSSGTQGIPPGLYRVQTLSLPLQALLSQRSILEQDLSQQQETALDRTTLEAILFAQSESESPNPNQGQDQNQPSPRLQTQLDRIPEVVACQFSYFDGSNWLSSWDSNSSSELPIAVRVRLRIISSQDAQELATLMSTAAAGADSSDPLTEQIANSGDVENDETTTVSEFDRNTVDAAVDPLQNIRSKQVERTILLQPVKALITISGQSESDAGDAQ